MCQQIITLYHSGLFAGHQGVIKTYLTIGDKFSTPSLYHSGLFAGHQGVIKTYLTIGDKFSTPSLIHHLRSYIK